MYRRFFGTALLGALLLTTSSGCLGRSALTQGVQKFNLNVTKEKWGREVVFVALWIIPVYETTSFLDLFIVNSIEFWTEKNPVNGEPALTLARAQRTGTSPDGTRVVSTLKEDGSIDFEVFGVNGEGHFVNLAREGGSAVARDACGRRLGRSELGRYSGN